MFVLGEHMCRISLRNPATEPRMGFRNIVPQLNRGLTCGISRAVVVTPISKLALCVVLLAWLTWPVVETFDTWDQPVHTGNDSQYTLVVLGVCAGAVYVFSKRRRELLLVAVAQVIRTFGKMICGYLLVAPFVSSLVLAPDDPSPPIAPTLSVAILRI